jgi:hypothetical protein
MTTLDNAHALVVGIAKYRHATPLPQSVLNDARDVCDLLVAPQRCGYLTDNVELLLDEQATRDELRRALADLAARANDESVIFIYVSSHGGRVAAGPHAGEYILPVEASLASGEETAASAISGSEFARAVEAIPAKKVVVVLDCCYAAGIKGVGTLSDASEANLSGQYYDALKAGRGRVVIASARGNEFSHIIAGARNSLFTTHLLEGLRGGVASDDNYVRVFDLFEYVQPRVTVAQSAQHPVFRAELEENFVVAAHPAEQPHKTPAAGDGYRYDAFISFADREPDATFVWNTLVPRLEAAGLKIAVAEDVEQGGVARVVSAERGLKQSKRTIIVLSDNYLADRMEEFRNSLAQGMGIEEGTYRLLPLKFGLLDEKRIPERIKFLVTRDLAHPRRAESQFKRLIEDLQGELPKMDAH